MIKLYYLIGIFVLFSSCKTSNRELLDRNEMLNNFRKEVNIDVYRLLEKNAPLSFDNLTRKEINFQAYFESFHNSGTIFLFNVKKEDFKNIVSKYKNLKQLNNNSFIYNSDMHLYDYTSENLKIKTPQIDNEFDSLLYNKIRDQKFEAYVIEKGSLKNVFSDSNFNNGKLYNYSIGFYYFKEDDKLVYWFLVYQ